MLRVKGTYRGDGVVLIEPLPVPPQTPVEVLIPEADDLDQEESYWRSLEEDGLVLERRAQAPCGELPPPVSVSGEPVSETIVASRR